MAQRSQPLAFYVAVKSTRERERKDAENKREGQENRGYLYM